MERKGENARGIGFMARCLICFPPSTQGTRFIRSTPEKLDGIQRFRDRIIELLNDQIDLLTPTDEEDENRDELYFSVPAQAELDSTFNNIESSIQAGGEFCQNRDYASKIAENIARLAGVIHAFEGYKGHEVSVDTLQSATTIVLWYAREFVALFSPPGPLDVINDYARLLDQWLINYVITTCNLVINRNDLLKFGPRKIRSRDIMNIAIQRLAETNRLACFIDNHNMNGQIYRKGTSKVQLSDAYYGQIARGYQPFGFAPL
jgi:hypothetical protein